MVHNWITIMTFSSRSAAEPARLFLEENGIPTRTLADDLGGLRPELAFARGVALQVKEPDQERARELLENDEEP